MQPILIITGLSGSGKSLAARAFEDAGYFCVDNLPVTLIPVFADLLARSPDEARRVALVIDIREGAYLEELPGILSQLRRRGVPTQILWFEAATEVLIRRFSETRRPHPLSSGAPLEKAIAEERSRMSQIREMADRVIETSGFNAHELRAYLKREFSPGQPAVPLRVAVVSFGFRHGIPIEADLVFDTRFLQNPFFEDSLKSKTGRDAEVVEFLERVPEYGEFLGRLDALLAFLLPRFLREGKSYLTLAVGCTGGRHRSVALAEALGGRLQDRGWAAQVTHRDLDKE